MADSSAGLQIIAFNSDKLTLLGTPSSVGTYSIDIKACNEAEECTIDNFNITVVENIDDTVTNTDLTTTSIIISSMTVAVCTACIASFCFPLIIGGGIVILRRDRNKTLRDKSNTSEVEQKREEEEKKVLVSKEDIELNVMPNSIEEKIPKVANVVSTDEKQ